MTAGCSKRQTERSGKYIFFCLISSAKVDEETQSAAFQQHSSEKKIPNLLWWAVHLYFSACVFVYGGVCVNRKQEVSPKLFLFIVYYFNHTIHFHEKFDV